MFSVLLDMYPRGRIAGEKGRFLFRNLSIIKCYIKAIILIICLFIEAWLIYNLFLPAVEQSNSVIHMYFSTMLYYRILNIVPCTIH